MKQEQQGGHYPHRLAHARQECIFAPNIPAPSPRFAQHDIFSFPLSAQLSCSKVRCQDGALPSERFPVTLCCLGCLRIAVRLGRAPALTASAPGSRGGKQTRSFSFPAASEGRARRSRKFSFWAEREIRFSLLSNEALKPSLVANQHVRAGDAPKLLTNHATHEDCRPIASRLQIAAQSHHNVKKSEKKEPTC